MLSARAAAAAGGGNDGNERAVIDRRKLARLVVHRFRGRFSVELGLDVDQCPGDVERWFLAATLFGTRISTAIAMRTYRALATGGVCTVPDAGKRSWDDLVVMLDEGGYARYDFRTATRLQHLATALDAAWGGRVGHLLAECRTRTAIETALDELPGWGTVTVRLFLRELLLDERPAIDERAVAAGVHVGLIGSADRAKAAAGIRRTAAAAGLDARDVEAALVRLWLRHRRMDGCPGGSRCTLLATRALQPRRAKTAQQS
jgi:hypothetical protein